jgi:hypothetical protein
VSKGAKIAIGCGIAAVLAVIVLVVGVVGLGYWGKSKLESGGASIQELGKLTELKRQTAALPFTPPSDGIIQEARLLKFLEIRKAIHPIYEHNRTTFETMRKEKKAGFGDVMKLGSILANVQLAQAKAQLAQGVGDEEYNWLKQAIYKTRWSVASRSSEDAAEEGSAAEQPSSDVPAENLALLQKYQDQIELYSMNGLEFAGM